MINIFEDLRCSNIEDILLEFKNSSLEIFGEKNLIFARVSHKNEVIVIASGSSICVALERAESYVGGEAHFSMPDICLSTKSKIDRLILDLNYTILLKSSNNSLTVSLLDAGKNTNFYSSGKSSIGYSLYVMEEHQS